MSGGALTEYCPPTGRDLNLMLIFFLHFSDRWLVAVGRREERRLTGWSDITTRADGVSILKVGGLLGTEQPAAGPGRGAALSRPDRFQIDTNRSQPAIH